MATDQQGMSLYEIFGAPLHALVEAETHAARATAEFIRDFGFEREKSDGQDNNIHDFGKLRTITFIQEKRDREGKLTKFRIEVPLLSLIPIPALQIKDAELEFYVKILETIRTSARQMPPSKTTPIAKNGQGTNEEEKVIEKKEEQSFFPSSRRVEFKGALGTDYSRIDRKRHLNMQVKVKINMEQADIPAGLSKLFNLMDQGISSVVTK